MKIIDPHCHMVSRVMADYEAMALAGVRRVVEPAFWLGEPRKHAGTFFDYFDLLCGYERQRAAAYLIDHYCALAVNPRESNNTAVRDEVLERLPEFLERPSVLAVGEIGFDDITKPEEESMQRQLEIAQQVNLPVIIHTPHVDKLKGLLRTLDVLKEAGISRDLVVLDHTTEETVAASKDSGFWCGFTVYNVTKLTPERAVNMFEKYGLDRMLVNSSCDWGHSDHLNVPRTVLEMRRRGFTDDEITRLVWENPRTFYAQSGRMKEEGVS